MCGCDCCSPRDETFPQEILVHYSWGDLRQVETPCSPIHVCVRGFPAPDHPGAPKMFCLQVLTKEFNGIHTRLHVLPQPTTESSRCVVLSIRLRVIPTIIIIPNPCSAMAFPCETNGALYSIISPTDFTNSQNQPCNAPSPSYLIRLT